MQTETFECWEHGLNSCLWVRPISNYLLNRNQRTEESDAVQAARRRYLEKQKWENLDKSERTEVSFYNNLLYVVHQECPDFFLIEPKTIVIKLKSQRLSFASRAWSYALSFQVSRLFLNPSFNKTQASTRHAVQKKWKAMYHVSHNVTYFIVKC